MYIYRSTAPIRVWHMNNETLLQFCHRLCSDDQSKATLGKVVDTTPGDICRRILEEFSTRILSQKIHPIREDDIYMASHKSYRAYWRRGRTKVGRATNDSTLNILLRIHTFLSTSSSNSHQLNTLSQLIQLHLNFPPSKRFVQNMQPKQII